MINMIKADLYRVVRSVAMYVALGIMLLMMGISLYMCEPGMISMGISVNDEEVLHATENPIDGLQTEELSDLTVREQRDYIKSVGGYQLDRDIVSKNMNLYYIFVFVAATVITTEFTSRTAKNTLSSSTSRGRYYASKATVVLIVCMLLHFANIYITYFMNLLANGSGLSGGLRIMTRIALLQLPAMLALASVLTGLSFMLRRSLASAVEITFVMICQILMAMIIRLLDLPDSVMKYDFQYMISALAKQPTDRYVAKCYVLCGAVCVVFLSAGWLSFRRAEIK